MNTTEQIILAILASAFAVFVLLAIIVLIQIIRLVKVLRSIALKAEKVADSAEAMGDFVKQAVGKISILRFVHSVADMVTKHNKRS